MLLRRWSRPLLATLTVLLSLISAVPVAALSIPAQSRTNSVAAPSGPQLHAQTGQTAPVTVAIWTCDVVRPSDVVTLTTTYYKPDGAYNCVNGLPDGTSLDIDGVDPDMVTETTATWNWIFYGSHQLNVAETDTSMPFDVTSDTTQLYALYERAVLGGGWAEIHIYDCAIAPAGVTTLVETGDEIPDGYSVCVDGNTQKRNYGLLVDGQPPTYGDISAPLWQLRGGNHVATANGGASYSFLIDNWTYSMDLYTQGEVTSEPPITGLPDTGAGTGASEMPIDREFVPFALLVASFALGYVSFRAARGDCQ